jgi:hypothetical protein
MDMKQGFCGAGKRDRKLIPPGIQSRTLKVICGFKMDNLAHVVLEKGVESSAKVSLGQEKDTFS